MKYLLINFLFFFSVSISNAGNYYEDAIKKFESKDFKSSILFLEKSIVSDPKDSKSWILLGKSYALIENNETALKYYEIAFTLKPESAELNLLLGKISYELNLSDKYNTYLDNLKIICPSGCSELTQLQKIKIN